MKNESLNLEMTVKIISTSLIVIGCTLSGFSQNSISVSDDLKTFAQSNPRYNLATITAFNNIAVKGSQYLFTEWTPGSVTTIDNTTYSKSYLFNFDKINHDLYVKFTEQGNLSVLLDKSRVKAFSIGDNNFVSSIVVDPKVKSLFYQILVKDSSKYNLYKLIKTKFVKADPTNIMNVQTGNLGSQYLDDLTYFVSFSKGELKKVNLSENSIRKIFKDKAEQVESYFNSNSSKEMDEVLLIELTRYLNN